MWYFTFSSISSAKTFSHIFCLCKSLSFSQINRDHHGCASTTKDHKLTSRITRIPNILYEEQIYRSSKSTILDKRLNPCWTDTFKYVKYKRKSWLSTAAILTAVWNYFDIILTFLYSNFSSTKYTNVLVSENVTIYRFLFSYVKAYQNNISVECWLDKTSILKTSWWALRNSESHLFSVVFTSYSIG